MSNPTNHHPSFEKALTAKPEFSGVSGSIAGETGANAGNSLAVAGGTHEITEEGESTARWHCSQSPGFWGTPRQITDCARCGKVEPKGVNGKRHYRDVFKPTFHHVCDACYEELPS